MNQSSPLHNRIDDLMEQGSHEADEVANLSRHRPLMKEIVKKSTKPFLKTWRKLLGKDRKKGWAFSRKLPLQWHRLRLKLQAPLQLGDAAVWWRPLGLLYRTVNAMIWLATRALQALWIFLAILIIVGLLTLVFYIARFLFLSLVGAGGTP